MWICVFWANTRQLLGDMECSWHSMKVRLYNVSQWAMLGSKMSMAKRGSLLEMCLKDLANTILELYFLGEKESSKICIICNPSIGL